MSVCYVAPGQHLLSTAGPTRNVLNLAAALSRHASVSVAFRSAPEGTARDGIELLQIDPRSGAAARGAVDDAATRGVGLAEFVRYTACVRRFVRRELSRFDLVFEKSWTLSGLVAHECNKIGVAAAVIENLVPVLGKGAPGVGLLKRARIRAARAWSGYYLRRAERIIAETNVLKNAMVERWRIRPERVSVVPLGVDRALFRPADQAAARHELGFAPDATVLLYSGIIDATHNLRPAVSALCRARPGGVSLHVIGDGVLRQELEQLAAESGAAVQFHGRVPYERVPLYIAAADLCLAPYEPDAFPMNQVAYSSLKIPEYMSVGRAVVSVPSGRVLELVEDGVTGFLFENSEDAWFAFLSRMPSRERCLAMGSAAIESGLDSWEDTALAYFELGLGEIHRVQCALVPGVRTQNR